MKIHEYNEMMAYLTRPGRKSFKPGGPVTSAELYKKAQSYGINPSKPNFSPTIKGLGVEVQKGGTKPIYIEPTAAEFKKMKEQYDLNKLKSTFASKEGREALEQRKIKIANLIKKSGGNITLKQIRDSFPQIKGQIPSKALVKEVAEDIGIKIVSGREKGPLNIRTSEIINDLQILKNNKALNKIIAKPDFNIVDDLLELEKITAKALPNSKATPARRLAQLLIGYSGDDPDLAKYVGKVSDDLAMAADNISPGLRTGKYGGLIGHLERMAAEKKGAISLGKDSGFFASQRKRLGELIQNITGSKGVAAIDEVKPIAGGRSNTPVYNLFVQGIKGTFNEEKLNQLDKFSAKAEIDLQDATTKSEKLKIVNNYNQKVKAFVTNANKNLKPGQLPIRAFELSLDAPKNTIKNKEAYNKYKTYFDDVHTKHGYSFKVPKDIMTSEQAIDFLKTPKGKNQILQLAKKNPRIFGIPAAGYLGYQMLKPTSLEAAEPGQMPQGSPGQLSEDQGLSFGEKAAIGAGAAVAAKPAWKYLAKPALKIMGSPAAGLAFGGWSFVDKFNASKAETEEGKVYDALTEGIKLGEGEDEKEILGSQVGMELLFPEIVKRGAKKLGVEFSKKGAQNALAALGRFALNPIGRAASIMTPTGLTLNAAAVAKRYYDFAKDEMVRLEQMKPEERKAYNEMLMDETYSADAGDYYTSEDVLAGKPVGYNQGGRVGFDEGSKPKNPGRRAFLKGITALAALPIVGRFFKLGKVLERASGYTGPAIEKIKGMPEWFPQLVKKLWNEGEDVTEQMAYGERQIVKRGTLEGGDDVDMFYSMDTGDVSIQVAPKKGKYSTESGAYNRDYQLDYKKGQADEMTKGTPPDDFAVVESRPVRTSKDDIELDWSDDLSVDDAVSDLTELEAFAKNKTTKQIHKKKGTKKKDVDPGIDPTDFFPDADF